MQLKVKEIINLLHRAAAALETPGDLNELDLEELAEDLTVMGNLLEESTVMKIKC
jgi:hypothetical protein